MGRKTKLALQILTAGLFVMLLTTFLFTDNFSLSSADDSATETVDVSSLEDGVYTGTGDGYGGEIEVEVTVEGGQITDVTIVSHNESPGVSDPAIAEVPGAIVEDNSADVEVVSGATASSNGIMEAVKNALSGDPGAGGAVSEEEQEEEPEEEITPSDNVYEDGTYEETVDGHNGPLTVEVTVEGGVIVSVEVLEHEETPDLSDPALEEVPARIVKRNGTDVDTISGATVTSQAIITAVENALGSSSASEETTEPAATDYTDGTYEATVEGHNGPLSVVVTVTDGAIAAVEVTEHEETEELSDPAIADVPAAIVESNSTDVDTVSGATVTSEAIIEAVETALQEAN